MICLCAPQAELARTAECACFKDEFNKDQVRSIGPQWCHNLHLVLVDILL